jgi:nucleoid DNA-binding protein
VKPGIARVNFNKPKLYMSLNKNDIVVRIGKETGLRQNQVLEMVQKTLKQIAEALANGDRVELRNFGVFEVIRRKARLGRNPRKPKIDVMIPTRMAVKFKAGKELKTKVLNLNRYHAFPPVQL